MHNIIIHIICIAESEESRILLTLMIGIMALRKGKWGFATDLHKLPLILPNLRGSGSQSSES